MKYYLTIILIVAAVLEVTSQAGAKVYGGLTTGFNRDEKVTPSGMAHAGYEFGIDGRLNNERMYFLIGAKYGAVDLIAGSPSNYFKGDKMSFIKGRVGLGFDLIRISPRFFITSKFAGSLQYLQKYNDDLLTMEGYKVINDGTAGLVTSLGVRFGQLNLDFEYEYGLFNMYNGQKNSIMNYISLLAGVNF